MYHEGKAHGGKRARCNGLLRSYLIVCLYQGERKDETEVAGMGYLLEAKNGVRAVFSRALRSIFARVCCYNLLFDLCLRNKSRHHDYPWRKMRSLFISNSPVFPYFRAPLHGYDPYADGRCKVPPAIPTSDSSQQVRGCICSIGDLSSEPYRDLLRTMPPILCPSCPSASKTRTKPRLS